MKKPSVFTVGHSTRSVDDLAELLDAFGVKQIVDVRSIPKSLHNPQFNKDELRLSLKERGIRYEHIEELGGLRHSKKDSINLGWRNLSFRGYADYMATPEFAKGLRALIEIASKRPTAVMCAEALPWRCHRSLIADALTKSGWLVRDIMSRTLAERHRFTVLERSKGGTDISEPRLMIRYRYRNAKILFVGINPHPGSFSRGVPFSNNKMFWYLLSDAGLLKETRDELRNDDFLKRLYREEFNPLYRLGFVNIIDRPTRDITEIRKGEEKPGRAKIFRIIKAQAPKVVCFIGKAAYEKYSGLKVFAFGWKDPIALSRIFVMHFPLRGKAVVRIRELREIKQAAEQ